MAILTITNLTTEDILLSDLYAVVKASKSMTASRPVSELTRMPNLQENLAAGNVSLSVALTADELASGLASPPDVIGADDIGEIASTAKIGIPQTIKKTVAAGGGGSADDVTVYAVNTLPYKIRIIDAYAFISAGAAGGRTITIRSAAAAGGTSAGTLSAAATGRVDLVPNSNASTVYTPGALVGLFLRRSDSAIAGEVFIKVIRES